MKVSESLCEFVVMHSLPLNEQTNKQKIVCDLKKKNLPVAGGAVWCVEESEGIYMKGKAWWICEWRCPWTQPHASFPASSLAGSSPAE